MPMQQPAPAPAPAPAGGGIPAEMAPLIEIATQILGHPPQSEEELMQALMILQQIAGQGGPGAGPTPGGPAPMAPGNAAMMGALQGGGGGGY